MKTRKWLTLLTLVFCMMTLGLTARAYDTSNLTIPSSATAIVYGKSGAGRNLTAYQFGNGENVMVLGFAIHGWEDNFSQDGGALVYTAGQLMQLLDKNMDIVNDYGWTIYVLPCMNPDGLIDGYSHNGPGRLTTTYLDSSGNLSSAHGVDLNRSFPTNWTRYTSNRNYNGAQPLASNEAKALSQFVQNVKGSGVNLCIDAHGWMSQIITSNGSSSSLFQIFKSAFPQNTYASCRGGQGYFTAYTTTLGYISCLFEFPDGIYSMSQFTSSGYCEKFNNCILSLAKAYGTYRSKTITVTTVAQEGGTVSGGGSYYAGDKVTLTATAQEGYTFAGWYDRNGTFLGKELTYSWTVSANTTVYARFGKTVIVTATAQGSGTVTGGGSYASGKVVTLTAEAASDSKFLGWYDRNGTLLGTDPSYSWTVSANTTVYARFGVDLKLTASRSGTASGAGYYVPGTTVTLTAESADSFAGWYDLYGSLISTEASFQYSVSKGTTLVAMFQGDRFYDVSGWYQAEVLEAADRGLIKGTTDISFDPTGQLTRGQVVTILARLDGADTTDAAPCPFTDVAQSSYYAEAVNWAYEAGIVKGISETSFDPEGNITRQDFITMVVRYLETVRGLTLEEAATGFTDGDTVSSYALSSVQKAAALGLVNGYEDGSIQPQKQITRSEGVVVLVRLARYLDTLPEAKPEETEPETPETTPEATPETPETTPETTETTEMTPETETETPTDTETETETGTETEAEADTETTTEDTETPTAPEVTLSE
jgi:hypothetical protein